MKPIRFHPKVSGEIREILEHYEKASEKVADRFWKEFKEAVNAIEQQPTQFHFDPSGRRRYNFQNFPYHILYRILPTQIRITSIKHNHRNPGYGSRRL